MQANRFQHGNHSIHYYPLISRQGSCSQRMRLCHGSRRHRAVADNRGVAGNRGSCIRSRRHRGSGFFSLAAPLKDNNTYQSSKSHFRTTNDSGKRENTLAPIIRGSGILATDRSDSPLGLFLGNRVVVYGLGCPSWRRVRRPEARNLSDRVSNTRSRSAHNPSVTRHPSSSMAPLAPPPSPAQQSKTRVSSTTQSSTRQ